MTKNDYAWRSVTGLVEALSGRTLYPERIEDFLTKRRVIARGKLTDPTAYMLEVGVVGRRRRVAVVSESGEVVPGLQLDELIEELASAGLGVRATALDAQSFGDPDFGAFDVDGELEPEDLLAISSDTGEIPVVSDAVEKSLEDINQEDAVDTSVDTKAKGAEGEYLSNASFISQHPHTKFQGPCLYITDAPMAVMPGEAANARVPLAVIDQGEVRAVVSESWFKFSWRKFSTQEFYLRLAGVEEGQPELLLRDNEPVRRAWNWLEELPDTEFTASNETATQFAQAHLGAAPIAKAITTFVPSADYTEVLAALLCGPGVGPALLLQALGLPTDVLATLVGIADVRSLPDAKIFDEYGLLQAYRRGFHYEILGHGDQSRFWEFYRHIALDNPWIIRSVNLGEIGAAVTLAVLGKTIMSKRSTGRKVLWGLASVLVGDALVDQLFSRFVKAEVKNAHKNGIESR